MCLAIPGKIISIDDKEAVVDFNGLQRKIDLSLVKARPGDYIISHAGMAIKKLSPKEAEEVFSLHAQSSCKK